MINWNDALLYPTKKPSLNSYHHLLLDHQSSTQYNPDKRQLNNHKDYTLLFKMSKNVIKHRKYCMVLIKLSLNSSQIIPLIDILIELLM